MASWEIPNFKRKCEYDVLEKPGDSSLVSYKLGILWYSQLQIAPLQAPWVYQEWSSMLNSREKKTDQ